ncbi:DUF6571 family protein [Streptomyces sp. CBMA123]|uniref:DUF6571 family protein n=1 Tax=Streptomyces sp. CBMA123 TaxID=1896313 RepID=UPI0016619D58|nr:DUF6571 family protein [Streptomyces sp. CBMA123]MBD0692730.1 hypothetical protein [Streptomyces sp. CBMA123]
MLGYEDVLNANTDALTAAATQWRAMAARFHTMQTTMEQDVLGGSGNGNGIGGNGLFGGNGLGSGPWWTGNTANLANASLLTTKGQIVDAQTEANAMASLLDEAHTDFAAAQKQTRDAADGAVKDGFKVTGTGTAVFDESTLDPATRQALHHDPEARQSYQDAADKWTKAITAGVQAATRADERIAAALRGASKAGNPLDTTFNGQAVGGGDAGDAQRAADLATHLDSLTPDQLTQLQDLMKDKADHPAFSQGLLDRLGPDGLMKLAQQLNSPSGDKKAAYTDLQGGLTHAVASATQDTNTDFYRRWRQSMKDAGYKNYGSNTDPVYGYQVLTTLMTKGDAKYSAGMLGDLADDITATEKDHPDAWSYKASHSGDALGADPLDNVLAVMGREPDAATAYLDPNSGGGNQHLHYLLKDRKWPDGWVANPYAGVVKMPDPLSQSGLGAALEAATTGQPAGAPHTGHHTEAQARIMHDTVTTLDEGQGGNKVNANLRQPLANALADYTNDSHEIFNGRNSQYADHGSAVWTDANGTVHMGVGEDSLVRVMRGLSDNPDAYATLHQAESAKIAQELSSLGPNASQNDIQDVMNKGAASLGVYDAVRADVAMGQRDDANLQADWKAKVAYHVVGAPLTPIPWVGDSAQRLVDTWAWEWDNQMKDHNNSVANAKISDTYLDANNEMTHLVSGWAKDRGTDPDSSMIHVVEDASHDRRSTSATTAGHFLGRGNS